MSMESSNKGLPSLIRRFKTHIRRIRSHLGQSLLLLAYDLFTANLAFFLALWLRFDGRFSMIEPMYLYAWLHYVPFYTAICVIVFLAFKLYRSLWRFASYSELYRVIGATIVSCGCHGIFITTLIQRMPLSYYVLGTFFQLFFQVWIRFSYRFVLLIRNHLQNQIYQDAARVLLIGAGDAGQIILRDIASSKSIHDRVCCIIDDDPGTWGRTIEGVMVMGGREDILTCVDRYGIQKIYLAIPSASEADKREILQICKETGCELKQLPGIYQLVSGQLTVNSLKKVTIEDLLGRETIRPDLTEVFHFLKDKVILVTGGGGSIGSELCRQIASHQPKRLIIFDIYENNAYNIQIELKERYPDLDLVTLIGSVRDSRRIISVMKEYLPDIVFHAAAHKHVPLMEDSPCEAVKNNAIGTYKTAYAAMIAGVERFVLISTDKAVNPTNVMGATKRICEMVVQSIAAKIKEERIHELPLLYTHHCESVQRPTTEKLMAESRYSGAKKRTGCTQFSAVRFGNVLGSNGSVVPLFRRQIEKGGPVTVTHPDIIRYFMTIPEAVSLVLSAAHQAESGQIYVLDMGEPMKIDTLARNMIKMYGLRPDIDIMVEYTGLRPGEKLYEEKLMEEEGLKKTDNDLIHIGSPIPFDTDRFLTQMQELMYRAYDNDPDIADFIRTMVSTFHPELGGKSAKTKEKEAG